jgi:hypothetical protein
MFSTTTFSRKTVSTAQSRTSVASNLTTRTQSGRVTTHTSFIAQAAKRVVSAFEPRSAASRASWATVSTTVTMADDKETMSVLPPLPHPIVTLSETASGGNSGDEATKVRKRGPKITAMLTMFEHKGRGGDDDTQNLLDNRQLEDWTNSSPDYSPMSNNVKTICETSTPPPPPPSLPLPLPIPKLVCQDVVMETVSVTSKSSNHAISPLTTKQSKVHRLRSMASKMDIGGLKRERSQKEAKRRGKPDRSDKYKLDEKLAKSWDQKVDALAEWTCQSLSNGYMSDVHFETMLVANDVLVKEDGQEDRARRNPGDTKLLTPEEDLKECFRPTSCHQHMAAYFAKLVKEVSE